MTDKKVSTQNLNNETKVLATNTVQSLDKYRMPLKETLEHAVKMAIMEDRPILMDYWTSSLYKKSVIGIKETDGTKTLIKSSEEYTSNIIKILKKNEDYIIVTENSIYIIDASIPLKKYKNLN